MFEILIVDDEIFAVEGIKSAIHWDKLGITEVHTAFNIRQAKEVFEKNKVDIMLCDIEMPQGNGLELLAWVREKYPETECIFLTCHADFGYAKEAIKLGSLDYILKPVPYDELETVILKAVKKIQAANRLLEESRLGQYWFKNKSVVSERFWQDILHHNIASEPEAIKEAAKERNIKYSDEMKVCSILIRIQHWYKKLTLDDEGLMEFALKNIAEEKILKGEKNGQIINLDDEKYLVIFDSDLSEHDFSLLKKACEDYIEACNKYLSCDLCAYIGSEVYIYNLSANVDQLLNMDENNVAFSNKVFSICQHAAQAGKIAMPDMSLWLVFLNEGSVDKVIVEVQKFLQLQTGKSELNANALYQFQQDFSQMIYSYLKNKDIQAHKLLGDEKTALMYAKATRSVKNLLEWAKHITDKATGYANVVEKSQSVVDRAKKFISENISQDISREDIANHVFLNPDYLNRVFKKELGMPISEYIQQERFRIVKELLANTDIPVSTIALQVGYTNFSHFSKMFRKYFGMNPMDYRQKSSIVQGG
jgi:two-component system response regulator YesN